tara:strand:- start:2452 stop:2634 length:183 start_codon:yes stop_codon:yes gene_type:complete
MTETQILDLLERAYEAGCFAEVLKMIRAKSEIVLIEKVIEKSKEKQHEFDFDWDGMFGSD